MSKELYRSRRLEVVLTRPSLDFSIREGEWKSLVVHFNLLGFSLYWTVPWKWATQRGRRWGWSFHDWSFWWSFAETDDWHRGDSRWRRFNLDFKRLLMGGMKCDTVEGETVDAVVPMPEGSYPAKITKETRTWRRTRVPWWRKVRVDYNISIDGGIPFMGKGENSWDCGDDGLWGTGGDSPEAAIANAVKSALKARRRYGECASTKGRVVMARQSKGASS